MEEFRDLAVNNQAELDRIKAGAMASPLYNEDLAPTGPEQRTWGTYHLAALWVGLSIVITTYTLASGLITAGMTWWQETVDPRQTDLATFRRRVRQGPPGG